MSESYHLVVDDQIQIVVQGHDELSHSYTVPANGEVSFPPIGKLDLLDRTATSIQTEVASRLVKEGQLKSAPNVFVLLIQYAPRYAFMVGAIQKTIPLPVFKHYNILQILALAGGGGTAAAGLPGAPGQIDLRNVEIIRTKQNGEQFPFTVNVEDILEKHEFEKNVTIFPNDVIYTKSLQSIVDSSWVYVLGKVNKPGRYGFIPGREEMTLTKLIALAGDFNQYAKESAIVILRKQGDRTQLIHVDFGDIIDNKIQDVPLQPNDIVFVPESFL